MFVLAELASVGLPAATVTSIFTKHVRRFQRQEGARQFKAHSIRPPLHAVARYLALHRIGFADVTFGQLRQSGTGGARPCAMRKRGHPESLSHVPQR